MPEATQPDQGEHGPLIEDQCIWSTSLGPRQPALQRPEPDHVSGFAPEQRLRMEPHGTECRNQSKTVTQQRQHWETPYRSRLSGKPPSQGVAEGALAGACRADQL